ncbi:UDP-glucose 4-epimerase [Nocardiopsis sp. Huas11]|nr:UDP-glucose 4-epimerase [Nocardiopsis sp. Huas11]
MARVVVTGGTGFIGSHLVDALVARGDEVAVLGPRGAPEFPSPLWEKAEYVRGSVTSRADLERVITPGVDVVYHLAALVGVDKYLASPLDVIDVNFVGTRNVVDRSLEVGARVVYASTSEVFGKNPKAPWDEDADRVLGSTAAEQWVYSSSKGLAEHLVLGYVRERGLWASVVRYFNVYGPRQRPAFLISRSIHRALRGEPPVVYGRGDQRRSFAFVEDAVEATILAGSSPRAAGECFNVGDTEEVSIRAAVELIVELTGTVDGVASVDAGSRSGASHQGLHRNSPDTARIRSLLGWESSVGLRDGLARTVRWARENPRWLDRPEGASR